MSRVNSESTARESPQRSHRGSGDSVSQVTRATDGLGLRDATETELRSAVLAVCSAAVDTADAKHLLKMLGVSDRETLLAIRG